MTDRLTPGKWHSATRIYIKIKYFIFCSHSFFNKNIWDKCYYYPHFIGEETEGQEVSLLKATESSGETSIWT